MLLEAIELDPNYATPHVTLATISLDQSKYQESLTYSQKCVQLDPDYA